MARSEVALRAEAKYREKNREARRTAYRVWAKANPEKKKAATKAHRVANHAQYIEKLYAWRKRNKPKITAWSNRRRAALLQRTPVWADDKLITEFYKQAGIMTEMLGEPWHVDHVIPLRGKKVSGLHVHANMQLLPGPENIRKRNTFNGE